MCGEGVGLWNKAFYNKIKSAEERETAVAVIYCDSRKNDSAGCLQLNRLLLCSNCVKQSLLKLDKNNVTVENTSKGRFVGQFNKIRSVRVCQQP